MPLLSTGFTATLLTHLQASLIKNLAKGNATLLNKAFQMMLPKLSKLFDESDDSDTDWE